MSALWLLLQPRTWRQLARSLGRARALMVTVDRERANRRRA